MRARTGWMLASLGLVLGCAGDDEAWQESVDEAQAAPPSAAESGSPSVPGPPPETERVAPPEAAVVDLPPAETFSEHRAQLVATMRRELGLDDAAASRVRELLDGSPLAGQGRPDDTVHPMTRAECRAARARAATLTAGDPSCGAPHMVRVFDPSRERASDARLCVDQYEFPGIPCEYPVTYVTAREAALLCKAVGKRLCDAHEWEGACAGSLRSPEEDYALGKPRPLATLLHNEARELRWAYGATKDHAKCATMSAKSPRCDSTGLTRCGSNTYPAGAFPECVSPFGVYDQHGNAAEHMSLPLEPEELGARGGIGHTEMKGSWFVFGRASIQPHEDDCRWRAKDWHPSKVMDPGSHRNYHLGFRCCKDVPPG